MGRGLMLLVLALIVPSAAASQTVTPAAPSPAVTPPAPPVTWTLGAEFRRDRFDYRFENPSYFNTTEPVPHFFEQRYDADNIWFTGRVRYHLGGSLLETEGGLTPESTGRGSDYDTFFQPDGNIVVYGTTAVTDVQSWRASQHVGLGAWRGLQVRIGYRYRRDRSTYRPSFSTTIQTKPPSSSAFWNTDRETTISEVHEVTFGAERSFRTSRWDTRLTAEASPTTLARLTTILPDKYAEPVVFMAKGFTMDLELCITGRVGPWRTGASLSYVRTWSYQQDSQFHRSGVGLSFVVGR